MNNIRICISVIDVKVPDDTIVDSINIVSNPNCFK